MTYKEKLIEIIGLDPIIISDLHAGGVYKCPIDYFIGSELEKFCNDCRIGKFSSCENCWNRKYMNENINYDFIHSVVKGERSYDL